LIALRLFEEASSLISAKEKEIRKLTKDALEKEGQLSKERL
jgi:hypothetical protein